MFISINIFQREKEKFLLYILFIMYLLFSIPKNRYNLNSMILMVSELL